MTCDKDIWRAFTDEQIRLIISLESEGHGWAKFALSVLSQGRCSPKQETTMRKMRDTLDERRSNYYNKKGSYTDDIGGVGCSDSEAMSLGEYF